MIHPAPAVTADVVMPLANRGGKLVMALHRHGARIQRERQAVFLEQAQHAPHADAAAVFEHRLRGEVAVAARHVGGLELGHGGLGEAVAVADRVLGALLDVENEADRDTRIVRPARMRRVLAVADEISLSVDHHEVIPDSRFIGHEENSCYDPAPFQFRPRASTRLEQHYGSWHCGQDSDRLRIERGTG
jgi:hypothetical protein